MRKPSGPLPTRALDAAGAHSISSDRIDYGKVHLPVVVVTTTVSTSVLTTDVVAVTLEVELTIRCEADRSRSD
jgi:hypothetical protein